MGLRQSAGLVDGDFADDPARIGVRTQMRPDSLAPQQAGQNILVQPRRFPELAFHGTHHRPDQPAMVGHIIGTCTQYQNIFKDHHITSL